MNGTIMSMLWIVAFFPWIDRALVPNDVDCAARDSCKTAEEEECYRIVNPPLIWLMSFVNVTRDVDIW